MDITTELRHESTLLRTAEEIIQSVRDERDWFKRELEKRDAEVERLRAERDALKAALQSIANNTCCDQCQEAALVAKAALDAAREE